MLCYVKWCLINKLLKNNNNIDNDDDDDASDDDNDNDNIDNDDDDDYDNDNFDDDDNKSHFLWIYGCSLGSTETKYSYKEKHIQSLLSWHIMPRGNKL